MGSGLHLNIGRSLIDAITVELVSGELRGRGSLSDLTRDYYLSLLPAEVRQEVQGDSVKQKPEIAADDSS